MAMLDPGFMAMDPMLSVTFNVTRRAVAADAHGRPSITPTTLTGLRGTITIAKPDKLDRADDAEMAPRTITIVSRNQLHSVATGSHPDIVTWRGTDYTVIDCQPYPHFGRGFYQATAEAMNATDAAI